MVFPAPQGPPREPRRLDSCVCTCTAISDRIEASSSAIRPSRSPPPPHALALGCSARAPSARSVSPSRTPLRPKGESPASSTPRCSSRASGPKRLARSDAGASAETVCFAQVPSCEVTYTDKSPSKSRDSNSSSSRRFRRLEGSFSKSCVLSKSADSRNREEDRVDCMSPRFDRSATKASYVVMAPRLDFKSCLRVLMRASASRALALYFSTRAVESRHFFDDCSRPSARTSWTLSRYSTVSCERRNNFKKSPSRGARPSGCETDFSKSQNVSSSKCLCRASTSTSRSMRSRSMPRIFSRSRRCVRSAK
mmetsp:Transcript_13230/g.44222  ORF Transcript_13230/g.44222 Transcript_13230/m.44222 type:complete len:309 (+) Transcript_13230:747-1673(+)